MDSNVQPNLNKANERIEKMYETTDLTTREQKEFCGKKQELDPLGGSVNEERPIETCAKL